MIVTVVVILLSHLSAYKTIKITYGDSLGWAAPTNILDLVNMYGNAIRSNIQCQQPFQLNYYHVPTESNESHSCSACMPEYPLQKDGNICGIVALITSAVFCLSNNKENIFKHHQFLANPTRYNKFLRG